MRVRAPVCGTALPARTTAVYLPATHSVRCVTCGVTTPPDDVVDAYEPPLTETDIDRVARRLASVFSPA